MLTAKEIRESFLAFFESKQHQIVPSAPMVIKGDPTLMFTNAGMNQFKDVILGNAPIKHPRVADTQKCLRVSGKHNDLEEVGHDTYHHTMFEMLGNWSFGDYFKKEAINWSWEYLVDVLHVDPDRLYASVFEGSPEEGLERDDEASGYWEAFLPNDHIINGNKKDNFWEMGDVGPCGPCSEVHVDLRSDEERQAISGADLVNKDHPLVIEIWNLVFMQYNRKANGSLDPLPNKVIDTGMGFERLCMVLQGKKSNYDTDVFQPLIQKIAQITGFTYGEDNLKDIAMRVIADHIRAIAFSITDGQLPSNAKAGYVIRRILRRAVRYGYTFLEKKEAFIYRLLPVLIDTMGDAYPELLAQQTLIERVIKEEEDSFLHTLETGIRLLDKKMDEAKHRNETVLSGVDAFTLYDTFGFPLDLTELILKENNLSVDTDGFNEEMQKQKNRARNAAAIETGDWIILKEGGSKFVGYDELEVEAEILRYRMIKQKNKELYQIVLDKTPFYAEMGGQVGDTGWLITEDEKLEVIDTKHENNLSIHLLKRLPADMTATFTARVDEEKRLQTERNHTATHLLHESLREVLGEHVEQKGSYVSPNSLRFDFSHYQKLTDEELLKVEKLTNRKIRANSLMQEYRSVPIEQAKDMGALALFGEKYGDEVRVIQYGTSMELCGGTHIASTGMIGSLRIISESSIAAGVRRIEAVTGEQADSFYYEFVDTIIELKNILHNTPNLAQTIRRYVEENTELKKNVEDFIRERASRLSEELMAKAVDKNGVKVISYTGLGTSELLKMLAFQLRNSMKDPFLFVGAAIDEEKVFMAVMISDDLVSDGYDAKKLIQSAAKHIQGGGGGQPHFATAGGKNHKNVTIAVNAVLEAAGLADN